MSTEPAETTGRPARRPRVRHEVGPLADLPTDRFHLVDLPTPIGEVGVVRTAHGVRAYRNHCPHMGGPICAARVAGTTLPGDPDVMEYGLKGDVVRCPWHGWEFRVSSGEAVFGMSRLQLRSIKVEIDDDDVVYLVA